MSLSVGFILACNPPSKSVVNSETIDTSHIERLPSMDPNLSEDVYFRATGNEPFWMVEISEAEILYKTPDDSILFTSFEPIIAADANVKLYRLKSPQLNMDVQIQQSVCTNSMSGIELPYSVKITKSSTGSATPEIVEGCGQYLTDYRLHDIWVLESMNGEKVSENNFQKSLPMLEINSAEYTFMGFAGCNQMNGKLFSEKSLLRFTNISTTKMMCPQGNKESEFLAALRSSTTYFIENNRLQLSNIDGLLLVFKKID